MNKLPALLILIIVLTFGCKEVKEEPQIEETEVIEETEIEIDSAAVVAKDSVVVDNTEVEKKEVITKPKPTPKPKPKPVVPDNAYAIGEIILHPINHASMVLETTSDVIYVDPVGGANAYAGLRPPNFIIITDIHGDHYNLETVKGIMTKSTKIIGPRAIRDQIPAELKSNFELIFNGLSKSFSTSKMSLDIEGIPMYNLREEALQFHPKGRGNGYVLTINGKRIYISGDTEDIKEMRALKNIDVAFICMNLPYTMTEEQAADAVLEFKPKMAIPYHYRGSDPKKFKNLVNNGNSNIKVVLLDWYGNTPDS